jgi:ketosteroid isomerase-like protein
MPPKHVEVARAAYEAWTKGDMDALAQCFTEDVELHPFLGRGLLATDYQGHEGLRTWYEDANEPWEVLDVVPEEFFEPDDQRVVIFVRATAQGRGSHAPVEAHIVHALQFREDKIARLDGYANREMALEALGMTDLEETRGDD